MNKSTFKNGENRVTSPETKIISVRVTNGICHMLTYDLLQAIYFIKGEKQQRNNCSAIFQRKNLSTASYSMKRSLEQIRWSSALIKQLEDALHLHVGVEVSN